MTSDPIRRGWNWPALGGLAFALVFGVSCWAGLYVAVRWLARRWT